MRGGEGSEKVFLEEIAVPEVSFERKQKLPVKEMRPEDSLYKCSGKDSEKCLLYSWLHGSWIMKKGTAGTGTEKR